MKKLALVALLSIGVVACAPGESIYYCTKNEKGSTVCELKDGRFNSGSQNGISTEKKDCPCHKKGKKKAAKKS